MRQLDLLHTLRSGDGGRVASDDDLSVEVDRMAAAAGRAPAPVSAPTPEAHGLELVVEPGPSAGARLATWLAGRTGRRVQLTFTHNRSSMVSYRERDGVLRVRVHDMFRAAGAREWLAIADFVKGGGRAAARIIDEFVLGQAPSRPRPEREACVARGRFHDLQPIFDELNATYFHGAVDVAITWGDVSRRRYKRTIQLGVYVREERLIRIHPALDQAFVPRHYVAWIVFHEMLHDVFGIERDRGRRRRVHPREFMAIEQSYPDYARCHDWERRNIHRLLAYRGA